MPIKWNILVYFYVYFVDLQKDGRAGPKTVRYVINESYICIYTKYVLYV